MMGIRHSKKATRKKVRCFRVYQRPQHLKPVALSIESISWGEYISIGHIALLISDRQALMYLLGIDKYVYTCQYYQVIHHIVDF